MGIKISYAITVCNELEEIKRLVDFLLSNKRQEDEIVILFDNSNGKDEMYKYLLTLPSEVELYRDKFQGNFADWKNQLTSYCTGDYIFQIDADELPSKYLIEVLPSILENNDGVDVMLVPRVNTVEGLTQEHIEKWAWSINSEGWVNWPDYQWRIYRNIPSIEWRNKVHERLDGYKVMSTLPQNSDFALFHPKTIDRQEKQNDYYDTL